MTASNRTHAAADLSVFGMVNVLLRHRRIVLGFPVVGLALALGFILWQGRTYISSAAFLAQTRQDLRSGISGLASQLGLPMPVSQPGDSPAFYAELLQSRPILEAVVGTTYNFTAAGQAYRGDLVHFFKARGKTPPLRREEAIKALTRQITVTKGRETGLVRLSVETRYAPLSQLITKRMLELLNAYNLERRQSQAAAESRFVGRRLTEALAALRKAEDELQVFLQRNREFRNSPQLAFQEERLHRDVTMRQSVYTTISQLYEQARIEEVRDTPVITVVEPPPLPAKPAPRGWITKGLVGLISGGILGVLAAFGLGFLESSRVMSPVEFQRYAELRKDTLDGLRAPLRRARRLFGTTTRGG